MRKEIERVLAAYIENWIGSAMKIKDGGEGKVKLDQAIADLERLLIPDQVREELDLWIYAGAWRADDFLTRGAALYAALTSQSPTDAATEECSECMGTGEARMFNEFDCPHCQGTGRVASPSAVERKEVAE